MLGWFKKKFKKKDTEAEVPSPEEATPPISETEEPAEPDKILEETVPSDIPAPEPPPADLPPEPEDAFKEVEVSLPEPEVEVEPEESPAPESTEIHEVDIQVPDEEPEEAGIKETPALPTAETEITAEETLQEPEQAVDDLQVEAAQPVEPVELAEPVEPVKPVEPVEPVEPVKPIEPVEPVEPVKPIEPVEPVEPVEPEIQPPVEAEEEQPEKLAEKKKKSLFSRLSDRLTRTRESFTYQLDTLFLGKKEIDADLMDDLEELLITADLGVSTTEEILDHARRRVKRKELSDPNSLKQVIQDKIKSFIVDYQEDAELVMPKKGPFVIMVVGVNGVGKTTTVGKVANKFVQSGQSVLLVAADTFRAAAISQLKIWGERNNVPVATQDEGSDPSSVVFDAIAHAKAKQFDVVLVDTAGRLHTQANLMEELKKIKRVMGKQLRGAPHEVMLVIDATTGQNGISQAKLFDAAVDITGIALTKLDGTAKGGIVANICRELKTPIRFIGIGEAIEDLRDFDADEFVEALFQNPAASDRQDNA